MKKAYRYEDNQEYWNRRWAETGRDPDKFADLSIYPIKYAEMVMIDPSAHALEVGAGLGRVLKHYHYSKYNIIGQERSEVAVQRLKEENQDIDIRVGDVLNLSFADGEFDVLMAFGVYHNMESEKDLERALSETARCTKEGGRFAISMRPNNLEMNLNEWYWLWKQRKHRNRERHFHKLLVGEKEFREILEKHGLKTIEVHRARNFSILYRIPWLRGNIEKEVERRAKGYRLNVIGRIIDKVLTSIFPSQFCNVLVFIGIK